jgi:hypothetical protein
VADVWGFVFGVSAADVVVDGCADDVGFPPPGEAFEVGVPEVGDFLLEGFVGHRSVSFRRAWMVPVQVRSSAMGAWWMAWRRKSMKRAKLPMKVLMTPARTPIQKSLLTP